MNLEFAEERLTMWLDAEKALAHAQSYMITTPGGGQQQVTRANLSEVRKQIQYWQQQVSFITTSRGRFGSRAEFRDD